MTVVSATTITIWRIVITSTVEDRRARRFTSVTTRDISSAVWRLVKNDSDMRCRWA
jgi:hypothetical protein